MNHNNFINNLLYLYNNVTIIINLKEKKISHYYDSNNLIDSNISIDEFVFDFSNRNEFNLDSKNKLTRFFSNFFSSNDPFSINATYILKDESKLLLNFKGYKYDNDDVLLVISRIEDNITNSTYDYLTKVLSRESMVKKVNEALLDVKPFTLMIIDIDYFKQFNDSYGHMYGDIVLVEVASALKKYVSNNGYVGRIGGDEFLLLLYIDNDYEVVHDACSKIKKVINNISNHNIKKASITATIGCALYPNDGNNYYTLFKKIDKALYRGKRKGRNCFIIYDEEKCGKISDEFSEINNNIDSKDVKYSNFNIISAVSEILNKDNNYNKNIYDSLDLIGTYFVLDRIALYVLNIDEDNIKQIHCWCSNNSTGLDKVILNDKENIDVWRDNLDSLGMLKIVQVESNKHLTIYNDLHNQQTSAILAFELKCRDENVGFIRFDMCSINRFWQTNDIYSLMVISKLYAIFINKINEQIKHNKELYYDRLTSIYNYIRWRDLVQIEVENTSSYSVMYFDIEGFKHLNDIYGSKVCDEALITIAEGFKEVFTTGMIYSRVADDKFLCFIPTDDKSLIESVYNYLENKLRTSMNYKDTFHLICGVYINKDNDILTTSIDKANIARKQPTTYKEGLCYFSSEQYEEKKFKTELELHMFEALDNNEFLLYLQPKVNIKTGEVIGAEALTRWNFKHENLITPNLFIPLFEQNGFIKELDYKVFENVCIFLRKVIDNNNNPIIISVNISRYQKDFDTYINKIDSIRKDYNIPPELIELEITEGMYVSDVKEISNLIKKLHYLGYRVSMDDFGSGYSNLAALADMDFDLIKLDKGFCVNTKNEKEKIILSFVMELAHELDMDVLCEGVETKEFMEYLKSIGCNIVQGYLFDKPIPEEHFYDKYIKKI